MIAWQMCRNSFSHSWCGRPIYMCSKCNLDRLFIFVLVPNKNECGKWDISGKEMVWKFIFVGGPVKIIQKIKIDWCDLELC